MNIKLSQTYFLFVLIAISSVLTFFIFRPFLVILVLAGIFAVILQPLYRAIFRHMSTFPGLAAFATIVVSVVCILIPLSLITNQVMNDAQDLYASLSASNKALPLDAISKYANNVATKYVPGVALSEVGFSTSVDQYVKNGLTWLIQNLSTAFNEVARLLFSFFIFLIALYYLLRDGKKLKQTIIELSPLADSEDKTVFTRLELAIHSIIRGSLSIALIQGVLTGIGFAIFGVPHSIFWGVVAMFAALIPGIGTSLVLIPGIVYLFITSTTTSAVGLLIWSFIAVGLIDNFLGPRLVGKGMQLHPGSSVRSLRSFFHFSLDCYTAE